MVEIFLWGTVNLVWWEYIIIALILTHITIAAVTIFLHRCQAHRSVELHAVVSHFFRFWLWLTTGMVTKEWAAIHRKHHAKTETDDDPHSPQIHGIASILWGGVIHYTKATKDKKTIERYGYGTPDDWIEKKLYSAHPVFGVTLMAFINVGLFGLVIGMTIWAVQMIWIPFWAAGVINGIGHYWGYRNFQPQDESRNIVPLGVLIGGEELHNNHHAFPTSARLSNQWYEFDIGWMYIYILEKLKLARVKRVAPQLLSVDSRSACDLDMLQSIIANRLEIMSRFAGTVKNLCQKELQQFKTQEKDIKTPSMKTIINFLHGMEKRLTSLDYIAIKKLSHQRPVMSKIFQMRHDLVSLWEDKTSNSDVLVERLRLWCQNAEASGIESLEQFSQDLRGYSIAKVS